MVAQVVNPNPQSPAANIIAHGAAGAGARGRRAGAGARSRRSGVGFQPPYATEGKFEALEFAAGNYGLLESAFDYATRHDAAAGPDDQHRNVARGRSRRRSSSSTSPSVIHYTTGRVAADGVSPAWDSTGPREPGEVFHVDETTTFRWRAEDIKGNVVLRTGRRS